MKNFVNYCIPLFILTISLLSCSKKIKEQQDEVYSRHLQEHVPLTIISTPVPENKNELNLLLLNDGQDAGALKLKETISELYEKKLVQPLLIVAIYAVDRNDTYGIAGYPDYANRGGRADKYAAFIDDELYAFIKKKAGVRKFNSVVIAGTSLGGLSAFDIAWNHADKIDKAGIFSGSFWWRDKDVQTRGYSDSSNRILLSNTRSSRKKPHLKYWFYAGGREETGDRDKDGIIDVIDDTKDLLAIIKSKNICPPKDIVYTEAPEGKHDTESWSKAFPQFLIWAFGK